MQLLIIYFVVLPVITFADTLAGQSNRSLPFFISGGMTSTSPPSPPSPLPSLPLPLLLLVCLPLPPSLSSPVSPPPPLPLVPLPFPSPQRHHSVCKCLTHEQHAQRIMVDDRSITLQHQTALRTCMEISNFRFISYR